jgi:hypothetical protein
VGGGPKADEKNRSDRPEAAMPKAAADKNPAKPRGAPTPHGKTPPASKRNSEKSPEPKKGQTKDKLSLARVEYKT